MKNEVFNRKEVKYIVDETQFKILQKVLTKYMKLDQHNIDNQPYRINTLYFDTEHSDLISNSLLKPKYKQKIRLRSYQNFSDDAICFLEIKKKCNGKGNKRRTKITYKEALVFIETGIKPKLKYYMNKQVLNELEFIFKKDKLYPKVFISYNRIAYYSLEDMGLRVTFDKNISAFRNHIERSLLPKNQYILEIKTNKGLPLWLARVLSENKIYERSFSKYGTEYMAFLEEKRPTEVTAHAFEERRYEYGTNFELEYC